MKKNPTIGIIGGTGKFGGWFRNFFEGQGLTVLVAGRTTALTPLSLTRQCDIVIISVPISATAATIKQIRDYVNNDALLCDLASVKTMPLKEMLKTKSRCGVSGIHPLFGPLAPNLNNQTIVFCPGRDNRWTEFLKKLFTENGAKIVQTDAKNHDYQMAAVQALTHFVNITFARALQKQKMKIGDVFTTPVFRLQNILTGRVLGGSGDLYADIEMENLQFGKLAASYAREVDKFTNYILTKNKQSFVRGFNHASSFMRDFIPIAQAKSVEILSLMDRQPIVIKQKIKNIDFGQTSGHQTSYLGPEGTFSHEAAKNIFPKNFSLFPSPTISQIFRDVAEEKASFGVVPIENSSEGVIQETMDNLIRFPLKIVGSRTIPIHLCLLARTNNARNIKIIKSHAQPIAQSRNWLNQNFPQAKIEAESSSVKAILDCRDASTAFIASRQAAEQYGLKILAENIEDKKTNSTQFYVIAKNDSPTASQILKVDKTLMILAVYDRPGVLRDILNEFAVRRLNLSKLHSRVSEADGWDYYFFIEVAGLPADKKMAEAIAAIKKFCSIARILGVS